MSNTDHGLPENIYNAHSWILGKPDIGEDVWIGAFTLIDAKYAKLKIGKGCNISSGSQILTHSTVRRTISERKFSEAEFAPVVIEDYCFIGTNAVILMGSTIGHHSVVGAGCVIPQNTVIPPYSMVVGVPGKIIGSTKELVNKT